MKIQGKSRVAVNIGAFEEIIAKLLEGRNTDNLVIKFDSREAIKTVFAKGEFSEETFTLTLYTGAIENLWLDKFNDIPELFSDEDALVFITVFMLKKYLGKTSFSFDVKSFEEISLSDDFINTHKVIDKILRVFVVTKDNFEKSSSKKSSRKASSTPKAHKVCGEVIEKEHSLKSLVDDVTVFDVPADFEVYQNV